MHIKITKEAVDFLISFWSQTVPLYHRFRESGVPVTIFDYQLKFDKLSNMIVTYGSSPALKDDEVIKIFTREIGYYFDDEQVDAILRVVRGLGSLGNFYFNNSHMKFSDRVEAPFLEKILNLFCTLFKEIQDEADDEADYLEGTIG